MKSHLSFAALGLVLAAIALGIGAVIRPPSLATHETTAANVARAVDAPPSRHVYCFNGLKGKPGHIYLR